MLHPVLPQAGMLAKRLALTACLAACVAAHAQELAVPDAVLPLAEEPAANPSPFKELGSGMASWYGPGLQGRRTASGERFNVEQLTAAHPTLPFGTLVRVRNPQNGREVVVRINDRGPHARDRIIDLSKAAARALGLLKVGAARVVLMEH